jgi:type VI protein secretion system component Hcp
MAIYSNAQVTIYARFTLYSGSLVNESTGKMHQNEILLTSYSSNEEQTLNIGSQSTGAGAGKVTFNPVTFTKPVSVNSPMFFSMMASGTPFKKVEFLFYNAADVLIFQQTMGLVAVKTTQHSVAATCAGTNCTGLIETISMEFGQEINTVYTIDPKGMPGKSYSNGWDRIKNIKNDEPNSL